MSKKKKQDLPKYLGVYRNYNEAVEAGVGEEYLEEARETFYKAVEDNKGDVEELELVDTEWNEV